VGTGVSILQGQSGHSVNVTIHSYLVPRLRMGGAVPLLLLCASLAWRRQIYCYFFTYIHTHTHTKGCTNPRFVVAPTTKFYTVTALISSIIIALCLSTKSVTIHKHW